MRLAQAMRYLAEMGWLRGGLAVTFALFFMVVMTQHPSVVEQPYFWALANVLLLASVHTTRNDGSFLAEIIALPALVFVSEYLVLSFPISVLLMVNQQLLWSGSCLLSAGLVSLLPLTQRKAQTAIFRLWWVAKSAFEWQAGWRLHGAVFAFYMVLGMLLGHFHFAFLPSFLLLSAMNCSAFYTESEPLGMLEASGNSATNILKKKLLQMLREWGIIGLPYLTGQFAFFPLWNDTLPMLLAIGAWLIGSLLLTLSILMKYANYQPHSGSKLNSFYIGLSLVSFLVPFLMPLPFLFLIRFYRKATANLAEYLT